MVIMERPRLHIKGGFNKEIGFLKCTFEGLSNQDEIEELAKCIQEFMLEKFGPPNAAGLTKPGEDSTI